VKVLLINKFLYPKGGDAVCTLSTGELLSRKGHQVFYWGMKHPDNPAFPHSEYFIENIDYDRKMSKKDKTFKALKIFYSLEAKKKINKLIKEIKPDIVHLNNFAHQISPSILYIFKKYNIPVVMTMHDYKLVCPAYLLFSGNKICESCRDGRYYWCLFKKCVKKSYAKSLINAMEMYLHHKILRAYSLINLYIAPSMFLRDKVKQMGFKNEIVHLPNFVNLDKFVPNYEHNNEICYFGRLSPEKGLGVLIDAVKGLDIRLKIIGSGPVEEKLREKVKNEQINNISFLGYKTGIFLENEIRKSIVTIMPPQWYEVFPRAVIESFSLGKPVIGARIGGIRELVKDGETGYTFEPGDPKDLRKKIVKLLEDRDKIVSMGKTARKFVEENFDSEKHYVKLINVYEMAIKKVKSNEA